MQKNVKLIAIIAIVSASLVLGNKSFAGAKASDHANLKITLTEVMTLQVSSETKDVNLSFQSAADYQNGVSKKQLNHLKVTSTGGFKISVSSKGDLLNGTADIIPINTISLEADGSKGAVGNYAKINGLSTQNQELISSEKGTLEGFYNVEYTSSGGAEYINKENGDYKTEIIYSMVAK